MSDVISAFQQHYGSPPQFLSRAPGRVEFIGNHTDYNGGEVLGAAVDRFLSIGVSPRDDTEIHFASSGNAETVSFANYAEAKERAKGWVKYPMGVLSLLVDVGIKPESGFNYFVTSEIPSGAGLSSSAALELASSIGFELLSGKELDPLTRVKLCRRAENEVVGVPCGILDQGVSGFGEKDRLVHIDCSTEDIKTVAGPLHTCLWIFESGKKHSLVDSLYSKRHGECREAFQILKGKLPEIENLADVSPKQLQDHGGDLPPEVLRRARHIVEEHERVQQCVRLLREGDVLAVGDLLKKSHWSSSKLFENSIEEIDTLVRLLSEEDLVFGARLTGGGFGGAVMALCDQSFSQARAEEVAAAFKEQYGYSPKFRALSIAEGARRVSGVEK